MQRRVRRGYVDNFREATSKPSPPAAVLPFAIYVYRVPSTVYAST
jgi:hypothetical protein